MTSLLSAATLSDLLIHDTQGMVGLVRQAPARGLECLAQGRRQALPAQAAPSGILICGMGGSGSTGDMLQAICDKARLPISVCKSPLLPAWVSPQTLVICISYSGNTHETLSCLNQASQAGARLLGLTSGGQLAKQAQVLGFPLLNITGGLPPRAALFEMLFTLLGCLEGQSWLGLNPAETDAVLTELESLSLNWSLQADQPEPLPLELARSLYDSQKTGQILLWGISGQTEAVAMRWKNQLSENAKTLASVSVLPELNHNEIVPLCSPWQAQNASTDADAQPDAQPMCARHHSQSSLICLTLETVMPASEAIALDLVRPFLQSARALTTSGGSRLSRLLYLVYLGDIFSVYLALLKGINPTPIAAIDELKRRMA